MDPKYDWLNSQIERLRAGMGLGVCVPGIEHQPDNNDFDILRMAATLSGARSSGAVMDPSFKARLGVQVREAAASAAALRGDC